MINGPQEFANNVILKSACTSTNLNDPLGVEQNPEVERHNTSMQTLFDNKRL